MLDEDEDERRQQCPLCDESSCRHLVGEGDPESMEWSGGLSDVPEVWALISQAVLTARGEFFEPEADCHILKEIFADVPPWDKIEEDQAPEDFFREHHPRVDVCSVFWDGGLPGANGYVYYVYMTEEDQAQASKDLRRLQELIPNQLGLFEDAMSCREALRKSPRNERAWYNLACYCARLRRKDDCMFALKQAIYLNHERGKMAAADINFDEFWNHRDFGKLVRRVKKLTPRDLEPGRDVALNLMSVPRAEEVARAAESEREKQKPPKKRLRRLAPGGLWPQSAEDKWHRTLSRMPPDQALLKATVAWEHDLVAQALENGADPDTADDSGSTALMIAITAGGRVPTNPFRKYPHWQLRLLRNSRQDGDTGLRICRKILSAGADPNIRNAMGQTALDLALTMSEPGTARGARLAGSIAAMLLDQDAREGLGGDIKDACDLGDTELLRALIHRQPKVHADGLFSYAEKSGNVEILKVALEAGANPTKWDFRHQGRVSQGDRADFVIHFQMVRLRIAVEANDPDAVALLLEHGAGIGDMEGFQHGAVEEARRCLQLAIDEGFGEVEALLRGAGVESTSSRPEEPARGGGHGESVMTLDDVPVRLRKGWDDALPPATSKLPTDSKTMFLRGALTPAKRKLLHLRMADSRHPAYAKAGRPLIWDKAVDPANSQEADYVVRPAWTFKGFVRSWAIVFVPLPGIYVAHPIAADAWRVRLIHSYTRFDQVRVGVSEVEARFLTFFRRGAPVAMLAPLLLGRRKDDGLEAHELKLRQQEA